MKQALALIQTTVNQYEQAMEIANTLVEEGLCACFHIMPISSVYRWQEHVVKEQEYLLSAKTIQARCAELKTRLAQLHPYEVPEIIVLDVHDASQSYADWVGQQCT